MALPKAPDGFEWEEVSEAPALPEAPEGYSWEEEDIPNPSGRKLNEYGYATDTMQDLLSGMGDATTFGLMRIPETAAVATAMGYLPEGKDKTFKERWPIAGKFVEERKESMQERSPLATISGQLIGGVASGRALPAANIGPASGIARYGANVGLGGVYGAGLNVIDEAAKQFTTGEYSSEKLKQRALAGAGTGTALSTTLGPAMYAVQKALPGTRSLRTGTGAVADPRIARGATMAKSIERGKEEAMDTLRNLTGNRGTVAEQPGSSVTRMVESVGPTPAGSKLERNVLTQASQANNAALEQQVPTLAGNMSSVVNPTAKVQQANSVLKDYYAKLASTINNAEDNFRTGDPTFGFSFDEIASSLGKNASSIVNTEAIKVLKMNPTFLSAIDDVGYISPRMMEAVIESMGKARQAGSSYHKATEITEGLQKMLESRFNGYSKMIRDYRKIHEYEDGLRAFNKYLTPDAASMTKQKLSSTGKIGYHDAEIAARTASVQPTSGVPEKRGLLRSLGNVMGAGSYSAPAAGGTAIREASRAAGHQYDKKAAEDLARYLNLTPKNAMDYLNAYGVYRPGTYVPALQNIYNLYKAREETK